MEHSIPELPVFDARCPTVSKAFNRLKMCINEYCKVNSISGLLNLGFFHRIFWTAILVVSVIGCYFTNLKLFAERHILILYEENLVSTYDIPFPAVTVCSTIKADHRKFRYIQDSNSKKKEDSINNMLLKRVVFADLGNFRLPEFLSNLQLDHIQKRVKDVGIEQDDLIASCSINRMACNWSTILTPDGLCYTFNMASPDDMFQKNSSKDGNVQYERGIQSKGWTHKNGYENRHERDVYPIRGIANNKLKLRLQININDLENSHNFTLNKDRLLYGFFVYVGHPMDYPHKMENRIFVPPNTQYDLKVFPDLMLADKTLKKYSIKSRNCLIDDSEWKNMKVFNQYSMNNCLLECIGKMTSKDCGCYPFYVPGYDNATCGQFDTDKSYCYNHGLQWRIDQELMEEQHNYSTKFCNCTQPCSYLTYDTFETCTGILQIPNDTFKFSDVTIRLASSEFIPKRRQESRSDLDMLAAIGGALGLFIGASVMSIIEFVYYFSVKIWVKLMMWRE